MNVPERLWRGNDDNGRAICFDFQIVEEKIPRIPITDKSLARLNNALVAKRYLPFSGSHSRNRPVRKRIYLKIYFSKKIEWVGFVRLSVVSYLLADFPEHTETRRTLRLRSYTYWRLGRLHSRQSLPSPMFKNNNNKKISRNRDSTTHVHISGYSFMSRQRVYWEVKE